MKELTYSCCGDYLVPHISLPDECRPIGRWGRMHREYIKEYRPILYTQLCLNGELCTYLADLNEQAQNRFELIIEQRKATEGVKEDMDQRNQMEWVRAMSSILSRADKIIKIPTQKEPRSLPCRVVTWALLHCVII